MNDLPKLSFHSYLAGGTYVHLMINENFIYAEKALELTKDKNLILHKNDRNGYFTLHYIGMAKDYIFVVGDFMANYIKLLQLALDNSEAKSYSLM
jgi:hypothetical protein